MDAASDTPGGFGFDNPEFRANPYPAYRFLREAGALVPIPTGHLVCTTHAGCTAMLRDNRFGHERFTNMTPEMEAEPAVAALSRMMLLRDPPVHTRLRGLVAKAFTARRIEALRPRIEQIVDQLIDAVIGDGGMDVIHDFAHKLPVTVICDLVGIPESDRGPFLEESTVRGRILDPVPLTRAELDSANAGQMQTRAYFEGLFAYKRANPGDDLTTALLEARENGEGLSDLEALANIALLFGAGHETTTNLIGNGTLALHRNPAQLRKLREQPELAGNAVEELLRYDSPVQLTGRSAHEDVELCGQIVPAGHHVIALLGCANHDPEAYAGDPDELDIARPGVKAISFGGGIHHCLGAQLARIEGEIAFRKLNERLPGLRLVDAEAVEWKPTVTLRGLRTLPAVW